MIKKTFFLIIIMFYSCKQQKKNDIVPYHHVVTIQHDDEKTDTTNIGFKEIYNYKTNLNENDKIHYLEKILKNLDNKRSFDTSFEKYSFPFVKRIKQPITSLTFYLFKNEYADAIYGNSSYPFFIDDTVNRVIYYCDGDSLTVGKTTFMQYKNVRENITKNNFYYNRENKLFKVTKGNVSE